MPLGLLISGPTEDVVKKISGMIEDMVPSKVIAVGDGASDNLEKRGVRADVFIVDNKVMRRPIAPIKVEVDQTLYLKNPPGTITDEAWHVVKEAMKQEKRVKILVEGEEDLLTLVAVLSAPYNSIVIYGQPDEGLVLIRVTGGTKKVISRLVDEMEEPDEKT